MMLLLPLLRGRLAERTAARHLRRLGYVVLGRNLRAGGGEIDILAREGATLVVVEVRHRARGTLAADLSVDRDKLRNLWRCLRAIRRKHRIQPTMPVRIDLVLLGDGTEPVVLRGVAI